jgi:nitrogen fixation protein NifQ
MCSAVLAATAGDPLLRHARDPDDYVTLALAAAIELARSNGRLGACTTFGLPKAEFKAMLESYFKGASVCYTPSGTVGELADHPELGDLVGLLLEHARKDRRETLWVAHAVAACCMGYDHLWQDLGMPDRAALRALLAEYFPALVARNTRDMRWKKFFYKQLCDRSGINLCRAPSCDVCIEYRNCFGPEDDD